MSASNIKRWRGSLAAGLVASLSSHVAFAAPPGEAAGRVVTDAIDRTLLALKDDQISETEADTILELIDVEGVARFSLGRHWRGLSDPEQAEFVEAFRFFARTQLRDQLTQFSGAKIDTVRSIERKPGDMIIITKVTGLGDTEYLVSWRMTAADGWKIADIEILGIWFAIEQRAQFAAILDRNGGDIRSLIQELRPLT